MENTTPDKQKILTLFDSKSSRNRRNIRQVTPTKNNTMGHEPQECLKLVQILYLNVQIAAKIYVGETYQAFVRRVSGFKYEQKCFNFIKFKWPWLNILEPKTDSNMVESSKLSKSIISNKHFKFLFKFTRSELIMVFSSNLAANSSIIHFYLFMGLRELILFILKASEQDKQLKHCF